MISIYGFAAALFFPFFSLAQSQVPPILVQAPLGAFATPDPSRTTTVIERADIDRRNPETVVELLRDLPGIEVLRQGATGQTASVFIRGARSQDTLVLIDGIPVNDAMAPSGGYDLSTLSPTAIARVEVYSGPQSVRFGAGALGGVINIITREGGVERAGDVAYGYGSFDTHHVQAHADGPSGALRYAVQADHLHTRGFSAAAGGHEPDGAEAKTISGKLDWRLGANDALEVVGRFSDSKFDLDRQGGANGDDPNDTGRAVQSLVGVSARHSFRLLRVNSTWNASFAEAERRGRNLPDNADNTDSSDHFLSETRRLEWNNEWLLGSFHKIRFDEQWRDEAGSTNSVYNGVNNGQDRREHSVWGHALTYLYESETWFGDIGWREDRGTPSLSAISTRASLGRAFGSTARLRATYGTGYKMPSLYQLYSVYGDAGLRPEHSDSVELAWEQSFGARTQTTVSAFRHRFRDLIDFDSAGSHYFNVARASSQGVQVHLRQVLTSALALTADYLYIDAVDENSHFALLRQPRQAFSSTLNWQHGRWDGFLEMHWKGARADIDPDSFARITDRAYDVWSVGANWQWTRDLRLSGRIENIFNKGYQEVAGYNSTPLAGSIGLTLSL